MQHCFHVVCYILGTQYIYKTNYYHDYYNYVYYAFWKRY